MTDTYHLNQSPLFKLRNRKRLARLLNVSVADLEYFSKSGASEYVEYKKHTPSGKVRNIEWPKPRLFAITKRLNVLLGKIECPEYIHSGIKGKSYVTNASAHNSCTWVVKIDLKSFFVEASYKHVYRCFCNEFKCAPDIASILCKLTTVNGHLPTGSPTSVLISYYAYKEMFETISALAKRCGLTMTLCVDDMTFSGEKAHSKLLYEVNNIAKRYGLKTHKRRVFRPKENKIITGVVLTRNGLRLPNKRRKLIHDQVSDWLQVEDRNEKLLIKRRLTGRLAEARQIEPKTFAPVNNLLKLPGK